MRVDLFNFALPESHIALRPAVPRDSAKLLSVSRGNPSPFEDHVFRDLPHFLRPGDLLVFNDTRVIPAHLRGRRYREKNDNEVVIDVTLHRKVNDCTWHCFARPAKRLKPGDRIIFTTGEYTFTLEGEVIKIGDSGEIFLSFKSDEITFSEKILALGTMPLPPYIMRKRSPDLRDRADYQTIYAHHPGAVAAPTAGLHFTESLLKNLSDCGILSTFITLHVGAGTFLPVKSEDTADHRIHKEYGYISPHTADLILKTRNDGGRIVAVGTTVLRLLESAADDSGHVHPFDGDTEIFIMPGYHFRIVDVLITNFHLPCSTLFMLVCAFAGIDTMQAAYAHAITHGYRFYSYGDSCLIHRMPESVSPCP